MAEAVMRVKESLKCDSGNEIKSHWCGWWKGGESKGGEVTHLLTSLNLKVLRSLYCPPLSCPRKEKTLRAVKLVNEPGGARARSKAECRLGDWQEVSGETPGSPNEAMLRKELCERKTGAFRGYSIPTRVKKWENRESEFGSGDLISPATGWIPIKAEAGTGKWGEQSLALTSTWHLNGWESSFVERSPWIKEKGLCSLSNHGILGNVDHLTENKSLARKGK